MSVDAVDGAEYEQIVQNGPKKVIIQKLYIIYVLTLSAINLKSFELNR